jgi:arginine utilization protein RocB
MSLISGGIMKQCKKCKEQKEEQEFYSGFSTCKTCIKEKQNKYYQDNKEKRKTTKNNIIKMILRALQIGISEIRKKVRKTYSEFVKRHPEYHKKWHIKNTYDLEFDEYLKLKQKQDNKCAICESELTQKCCIDHDHTTGKIRGILCYNCNTGLGQFKDSEEIMLKAVAYLKK